MKTQNKKKIIVSTLALAMGAALAGSISGSVAWYQYSTRAAAKIAGVSAGTLGNLQIRGGVKDNLSAFPTSYAEEGQYLEIAAQNFKPVSASGSAGSLSFYDHPVYQTAQLPALADGDTGYVEYQFYFRFAEKINDADWAQKAKKVYLSHFAIVDDETGEDVSDAVRVEIVGTANKFLLAKEDSVTTTTSGKLDLNNNGKLDTNFWDTQDTGGRAGEEQVTYTNGGSGSYTTGAKADVLPSITDPYTIDSVSGNSNKVLVETKESGDSDVLTVRVWLEGWAKINDADTLSGGVNWTEDYIKQSFDIQMQFVCEASR